MNFEEWIWALPSLSSFGEAIEKGLVMQTIFGKIVANQSAESVKTYILNQQDAAYKQLLLSCQNLLNDIFIFEDNWDMEPCSVGYHLAPLDWTADCHGDEEWTFMLNRQEYLWKLVLAYLVEKDSRYMEQVKRFIFSWIEQVTDWHPKRTSSRTLDTAIRCLSWLNILPFLIDWGGLSEDEYKKLLASIQQQLLYLRRHYRAKDRLSNWGIFQTGAMLLAYTYIGDQVDLEELHHFAHQEIKEQIQTQILEDGTQFEQSFLYHVEVYKLLLELAFLLPAYRKKWTPVLKKMADYVLQMTGPDGKSVALGDSDVHCTSDILQMTAIFFEDSTYLVDDSKLDLGVLFLVGENGLRVFEHLTAQPRSSGGQHFSESGHSVVKEGDSYLCFKAGPMGSAHSHSDQNSLCFYNKGQPIIIDSGRFSYRECEERYLLKSAWAHSTCILDGYSPEQIKGSWEYDTYPQFISHSYKSFEHCHWMQGVYQAKTSQGLPYWHKRQVLMVGGDLLLIVDSVDCSGQHELTCQLILDERVKIGEEQLNDLRLYSQKDFEIQKTVCSPRYNQLVETNKLVKKESFRDRLVTFTLLADEAIRVKQLPVYQTDYHLIESGLAFSCQGKGLNILLVVSDNDICKGEKLLQVAGYKLRGKCLVVDRDKRQVVRLKN
ncbi:alginate lyase family protein [Streptococcus suis]|nr:alginate lyase family protein [Streptococcus suis]HEM3234585.1 alginate lyase family protein [Streptococcus suis 14636]ANC99639.1 heparinase [Streptococcus suis]MCB2883570.1 alginate lyase family protein [Streptococcus suis]MCB2890925.1 alginate lyase family protein [Streptococcus suis]MCB2911137.1 alginate lyase family protein [Streptococcus suis]